MQTEPCGKGALTVRNPEVLHSKKFPRDETALPSCLKIILTGVFKSTVQSVEDQNLMQSSTPHILHLHYSLSTDTDEHCMKTCLQPLSQSRPLDYILNKVMRARARVRACVVSGCV